MVRAFTTVSPTRPYGRTLLSSINTNIRDVESIPFAAGNLDEGGAGIGNAALKMAGGIESYLNNPAPLNRQIIDIRTNGLTSEQGLTAALIIAGAIAGGGARGIVRGEGGRFGDLKARSAPNDDLTPHHIPQAGRGFTSYADGGAVVMTTDDHTLTRTYKARGARTLREEADLSFRDTLALDIRDVRRIGGSSYNKGLQDVLGYYRKSHPELMKKGR